MQAGVRSICFLWRVCGLGASRRLQAGLPQAINSLTGSGQLQTWHPWGCKESHVIEQLHNNTSPRQIQGEGPSGSGLHLPLSVYRNFECQCFLNHDSYLVPCCFKMNESFKTCQSLQQQGWGQRGADALTPTVCAVRGEPASRHSPGVV